MPELEIRLGSGTGDEGSIVLFGGEEFVLGRSRECDYVFRSDLVSRRHCRLEFSRGRWVLTDLGSTGGTYIDGSRVNKANLRPGAKVLLGTRGPAFEILGAPSGPGSRPPPHRAGKRPGSLSGSLRTLTTALLLIVVVGGLAYLVLREKNGDTGTPVAATARKPAPAPGGREHGDVGGPSPWSVTLPERIRLRPAAGDGRVVMAAGRSVAALAAGDGRRLWDLALKKPCRVSPVPTGHGLLVVDGGEALLVHPESGDLLARRELGITVQAAPAAGLDHVYIASVEGLLLALRLPGLDEAWRMDLDAPVVAGLSVIGERLVSIDIDGRVRAHDCGSGREAWTCEAGGEVVRDAAASADHLVVMTTEGALLDIDSAQGGVRCRTSIGERVPAAPAATGSTACVVTRAGEALGVDLADGTVRWRRQVDAAPRIAPVPLKGGFVIACRGGAVLRLDARDGAEVSHLDASATPSAAPTAGPEHLYIPTGKTLLARPLELTR